MHDVHRCRARDRVGCRADLERGPFAGSTWRSSIRPAKAATSSRRALGAMTSSSAPYPRISRTPCSMDSIGNDKPRRAVIGLQDCWRRLKALRRDPCKPHVDRRKSVPNARVNVSIRDSTHVRRFRSQGLARPAAGCEARVSIAQPCRRQRSKSVNGVVADEGAFARSRSGLATPARDRLPQISRWRPRCEATART